MANDLVFNMIANYSQFAAGMKQAQKSADALFLATATGAEKFAVELDNLQRISNLTSLDPKVFNRAYQTLIEKHDPFGSMESARIAKDAAAEEKRIATEKANYIAQVVERSNRMQWESNQNLHRASMSQAVAAQTAARQRTASIIASERLAAQASINYINQVAQFRERTSERVGRALIREAQVAALSGSGGIGGNRAMIIQQLAFAAEDAATQFGARGLAGAMMAAGNNITFAASMAHPAIGVFASLALTGAMVYQIYSKSAEETKRLAEENDKLDKALNRVKEGFQNYIGFRDDLKSQSLFPESTRSDQKYLDDAESNNRQLAILAAKRTQIMQEANQKGEEYSSSLYKRFNPFEMVKESDRRVQLQKQMNDLIAEESRLKIHALTIESRGEQVRAAELAKTNEEKAREIRNANAEEWLNESERIADIEDKLALRQEMIEAKKKKISEEKQANRSRLLSGAMDIRSVEAYGVMANAQARSMLPGALQQIQAPQATAVDKEIEKSAAKGAAILEKLLHEFGRRPSIPVVGLN